MPARTPTFDARRVVIYACLSRRKEIDNAVLHTLNTLTDMGYSVVFVSRFCVSPEPACADAVIAANTNSYFLLWAYAFERFPELYEAAEIVLTHDGVFGPMGSLSEMHALMERRPCAVWGAARDALTDTLRPHYLVFKRAALTHPFFRSFWKEITSVPVLFQEATFHNSLQKSGLAKEALSEAWGTVTHTSRPELEEWRRVITGGGLFIDKHIFLNPSRFDETGWTRLISWAGYPIQFISEYFSARAIDISATVPTGRRTDPWPPNLLAVKMHSRIDCKKDTRSDTKIAAFVHVYYLDVFDELLGRLHNLPNSCDIYISTNTNHKQRLLQQMTSSLRNTIFIHVVENKGFDIYPFLCAFGKTIFTYDVILKIHTKKSWHLSESESTSWRRSLYDSLLGTPERVDAILERFRVSRELGMVSPVFFDVYIKEVAFGTDYEALRRYLNRMGIDPTPNTILDFPMGSMFWCRPAALKPLFSLEFSEGEFHDTNNTLTNGTTAHYIERLFLFSCAASGLRWARVLPDRRLYRQSKSVSTLQEEQPLELPASLRVLYDTGVLPLFSEPMTKRMQEVLFVDYFLYFCNEFPQENFSITDKALTYLQETDESSYPRWLRLFAEAESRRQNLNDTSPVALFIRLVFRRKLNLESLLSLISPEFEDILFKRDDGAEFRTCCETIITEERPDILEGADTPETKRLAFWRWWVSYGLEDYPLIFKYYIERSPLTEEERNLAARGVPFVLQLVYQTRPDLQNTFPDFLVPQILQWWEWRGPFEYSTLYSAYAMRCNTITLPTSTPKVKGTDPVPASPLQGVNIIGLAKAELGIAEDTRMAAKSLESAKIPFSVHDAPVQTSSRQLDTSLERYIKPSLPHQINIVYLPAVETVRMLARQGFNFFKGRYTICNWQWELPYWPTALNHCLTLPQEIWAPSRYIYRALEPVAPVPLQHMPMAVSLPPFTTRAREYFNLPEDSFCFLFTYDGFSWMARKNPQAVVDAFHLAFPKEKYVRLILKSMNCNQQSPGYDQILRAAAEDSRIYLINRTLSRSDTLALFAVCDAYISLHRAEGFGRTIAEAMLLGKPVIVSNFSGNLDFCTDETAFLVQGIEVPVKEGQYPYYDHQYWFDPSIEDAAMHMRYCLENPTKAVIKALSGKANIKDNFSPDMVGRRYARRLDAVSIDMNTEYTPRYPFTLFHSF